ncbi:CBF domain-containing protein [Meloidogyne graminicola]|uniref:CBF domain-containing protein n=1 Tax=Meloidogyne graminicola TaxID=189291 RepID=A0A8S9Z672_9BILA|nr:CBF domain-containing protein [Meloidogyne graminicola]
MKKQAEILLEHDTNLFKQWNKSLSRVDAEWLDTVFQKGAFSDRIFSIQLRIQRSPVHSLFYLNKFVELVGKKGAAIRQAYTITKALKELFVNELLPPGRKLLLFNQRPLEDLNEKRGIELEKRLIMWIFEEQLKICYKQFVEGLQVLANNVVEGVAFNACREMTELLIDRSEQEQFLLNSIVNKLGHPLYRVGSKVAMFLEQLVKKHPNIRLVVIKEIEQLMFRRNILPKAQRYGLHFLSRILIVPGEFEIAACLVHLYLRFFRILILNDALKKHHLLPLLIAGMNRAFPYLKGKCLDSALLKDIDSLYAIVQTTKFSTSIGILRLLFQIHNSSDGITDRFYCAFYRRLLLLNNDEGSSQHDAKLFSLFQRVLKNDMVECRVRAFIKRIFQIALTSSSSFAAATLLTCSSIFQERPSLLKLNDSLNDRKEDENELIKIEEQIKSGNVKEDNILEQKLTWYEQFGNNDNEEENYFDIKTESSDEDRDEKEIKEEGSFNTSIPTGWIHRSTPSSSNSNLKYLNSETSSLQKRRNTYDPIARNPLFSGANFALETELFALARHYHPTVALFAKTLIQGEPIRYEGDPLVDLSHIRFLDKFSFKNPKTRHLVNEV